MAKTHLDSYDLAPGRTLAGKYEVVSRLGSGYEGEVYLLVEIETGIPRAAKFFFPQRNPKNKTLRDYARKMHSLKDCPILIQYVTPETVKLRGEKVSFLVSEYVEGSLLTDLLKRQRGKRLTPFQGLHLLHSLAKGMEAIHDAGDYHGDLHVENIIVERFGLRFDLKLFDLYLWSGPRPENIFTDVVDMIGIFHESLGGRKQYAQHPQAVKDICCGLKHSLIRKKYRTAGQLRQYLEQVDWESS